MKIGCDTNYKLKSRNSETEISTKSLPIPKYQAWVNNHGDSTKEMSEYLNLYK